MGWLVCVFQWTVCVWVFCGDSVDWWLWVFQMTKNIGQISLPTSVVSVSTENFCK